MVKKSAMSTFIPNRSFYWAAFFAVLTSISVCYGLRNDNLFYLIISIVLGIIGLLFVRISKKSQIKNKKTKR